MVSRRHVLRYLAALGTATLGGCNALSDESTPSTDPNTATPDRTPTPQITPTPAEGTPTDNTTEPTETDTETETFDAPGDGDWQPDWGRAFEKRLVRLVSAHDRLYGTLGLSRTGAVVALDPADGGEVWRTGVEGDIFTGHRHIAAKPDTFTFDDESVYLANNHKYTWGRVTALERSGGRKRWSVERERAMTVQGRVGDTIVALGTEFFEPDSTHDVPEDPLTAVVYGLAADDGTVRWTNSLRGVEMVGSADHGHYVAERSRLVALNSSGTERWTREFDQPATQVVALDSAVVALAGENEGATVHVFAPDGSRRAELAIAAGELLPAGGTVFAGGEGVAAIDSTGTVQWEQSAYAQWLTLSPSGDSLYTRTAIAADAVDALDTADGRRRWRFDPPSDDAWPTDATDEYCVAEAITPEKADFTSIYRVEDGTAAGTYRPTGSVYDVVAEPDTAYVAIGSSLYAFPV